jgi:hypothetical protein
VLRGLNIKEDPLWSACDSVDANERMRKVLIDVSSQLAFS